MTRWHGLWAPAALCLLLIQASLSFGNDDHDEDKGAATGAGFPQLNSVQQQAAGVRVAHPIAAKLPERIDGIGVVLDAAALLAESGEAAAAEAAERSASAEVARLRELYRGGAGASLKSLEAAQADQVRLQAQAQAATARFALHWGPIAALPQAAQQKILADAKDGRSLLVRADLPGRHSLGAVPREALLDVDGVQVHGDVLGLLRQTAELQSVGLLVQVRGSPPGFGPGARVPLTLLTGTRTGMLVPRDAVLYDENGAYVYKQLADKQANGGKTRYAPVKVQLLAPLADGWLTDGVDDDDNIVVHGAGVLWSLQGVGAHAVDNDEDED